MYLCAPCLEENDLGLIAKFSANEIPINEGKRTTQNSTWMLNYVYELRVGILNIVHIKDTSCLDLLVLFCFDHAKDFLLLSNAPCCNSIVTDSS